jgi:CRISPR-associated protein (TIGR02710 family)
LYIAGRDDPLRETLDMVEQHAEFLSKLTQNDEEAERLDVLDMLANASRRADVAQKYDDAVARLYSVLEALARYRLKNGYRIHTNAVRPDQIPETIRDDYKHRLLDSESGKDLLRVGLRDSYRLLLALDDPLGKKYKASEKDLKALLYARNQSRLAHGKLSIKPETYQRMRQLIMGFANVAENEIPRFPQMHL